LLEAFSGCQVLRYSTDRLPSYAELIAPERHWVGKQWTQQVERNHQEVTAADDLLFKERGDARGGYQTLCASLKFQAASFVKEDRLTFFSVIVNVAIFSRRYDSPSTPMERYNPALVSGSFSEYSSLR
jgi:hypothetical protein